MALLTHRPVSTAVDVLVPFLPYFVQFLQNPDHAANSRSSYEHFRHYYGCVPKPVVVFSKNISNGVTNAFILSYGWTADDLPRTDRYFVLFLVGALT